MRIDRILPHRNLVIEHVYQGSGPDGDVYADVTVPRAYIADKVRIVRDSTGAEATSTVSIVVPLEHWCEADSEVTVWAGTTRERRTKVIAAAYAEHSRVTPNHATLYCE